MTERGQGSASIVFGLMIIIIFTATTVLRNHVWRNPVALWSDVASKNSGELNVYISLGNAYLDSGMYQEALDAYLYVRAREATTSIRIYPNIGNAYIALKEYKQAEELFTQVLTINADDELSYVGRGKARFAQGRYAAAYGDFREAIQRNPSQARYYYYRGETGLQLHDREQARTDFARSCDLGWEEACSRLQDLTGAANNRSGQIEAGPSADGREPSSSL